MTDLKNTSTNTNIYSIRLAVLLTVVGCGLLIAGFVVSPTGEIHSSALVAFGEIMTFVAALLGISQHCISVITKYLSNHNHNGKIQDQSAQSAGEA